MRWLVGFLLMVSLKVFSFGNLGHETICQLAIIELTPAAKAEIGRLIELDARFDNFPDSSIFSEHPRQRREGHFLNLPRNTSAVPTSDFPHTEDCLFRALDSTSPWKYTALLSSARRLRPGEYLMDLAGEKCGICRYEENRTEIC